MESKKLFLTQQNISWFKRNLIPSIKYSTYQKILVKSTNKFFDRIANAQVSLI